MRSWRSTTTGLAGLAVAVALLAACSSRITREADGAAPGTDQSLPDQSLPDTAAGADTTTPGRCEPCTDPTICCPPESLLCVGTPDEGVVCSCDALWDCNITRDACAQPLPGGSAGDYDCDLVGAQVVCNLPGSADEPPFDSAQTNWSCAHDAAAQIWRCQRAYANPCNSAAGVAQWSCKMLDDGGARKLRCDRI